MEILPFFTLAIIMIITLAIYNYMYKVVKSNDYDINPFFGNLQVILSFYDLSEKEKVTGLRKKYSIIFFIFILMTGLFLLKAIYVISTGML